MKFLFCGKEKIVDIFLKIKNQSDQNAPKRLKTVLTTFLFIHIFFVLLLAYVLELFQTHIKCKNVWS